jgi:hypothetical protein
MKFLRLVLNCETGWIYLSPLERVFRHFGAHLKTEMLFNKHAERNLR